MSWTAATLNDVVITSGIQTGPFGSQLHAHDYTPTGVGVVMPQDLGDNVIVLDDMARIDPSRAESLQRHRLVPGDIVFSRRGDVTKRSLIRDRDGDLICGTGCLRVRIDRDRANPAFIAALLALPKTKEWLVRHAVGATMPNLNTAILGAVPLRVPELATQDAIAEVLGALDDKIAANHRTIETSESLSDALFSSASRTASGSTPAGTYFDLAYGKALPTVERKNGSVPVYGSGGIVGRHDSPLFSGPGVIVGRKGSVGTVYWAEDGAFPIDTTFFVRPHGFPHIFVYLLLKRMRLPLMAADSAVPGLNRIRVLQESVPALSQADAQRLAAQVSPLFTKNHQIEQENTTLTAVRDELLPQLMSGRITVKDAEKRVQEEV